MNEWNEVKLGEVINFNPRESISKGRVAKKVAMEKIIPFQKNINGYELAEFKGGSKFRNGDTLLARITPCLENGKTAKVTILDDDELGFGSTEYIVMREKISKTYNDFIYYLSISPRFREIAIKSMVGTSGRQRVQQDVLENTSIQLPSYNEQKAIADTLSCLDDKIELNNRINKNLEEMAQAIFKSWFVDFEPFQGEEFEDSELGRIPRGWRISKLKSICKAITKGTTPTTLKRKFVDTGINFIKAESINDNHSFDIQRFAYIDEETNELLKRSKIQENDILLTIAGTIGRYAMVTDDILPANTNQAIGIIRVDEKVINPLYLLNLFMCNCHKEFLESKVVQAVQANLSLGVIGDLPVIIPSYEILKKYYELAIPIFEKKKKLFIETQTLNAIRDSLLPKLMSGEVRVPIEEVQ